MTERWVNGLLRKELDMHTRKHGGATASWFELHEIAVKLLVRQHRAFVRMVKKEATESVLRIRDAEQRRDDRNALIAEGHRQMCAGILAALAKQGGGKK